MGTVWQRKDDKWRDDEADGKRKEWGKRVDRSCAQDNSDNKVYGSRWIGYKLFVLLLKKKFHSWAPERHVTTSCMPDFLCSVKKKKNLHSLVRYPDIASWPSRPAKKKQSRAGARIVSMASTSLHDAAAASPDRPSRSHCLLCLLWCMRWAVELKFERDSAVDRGDQLIVKLLKLVWLIVQQFLPESSLFFVISRNRLHIAKFQRSARWTHPGLWVVPVLAQPLSCSSWNRDACVGSPPSWQVLAVWSEPALLKQTRAAGCCALDLFVGGSLVIRPHLRDGILR